MKYKIQEVTLKVAYLPRWHNSPESWDWFELVGVDRKCQILNITADSSRDPTKNESKAIAEWKVDP